MFDAIYQQLPWLSDGGALITRMKQDLARRGKPFTGHSALRIMAFGNSKMLAGFIPDQFDREMSQLGIGSVQSWNFGLPGDSTFIIPLEAMLDRGEGPDVVLLLVPWPRFVRPPSDIFRFAHDDAAIMESLFPFRGLIRDASIMLADSHGSPRRFLRTYRSNERSVRKVVQDRGYYFIARSSHFLNDELPPDFHLPSDRPDLVAERIVERSSAFEHLKAVFSQKHVRCILIPGYYREGQYAPAPTTNRRSAALLSEESNFGIAGPDYFLYPNRLFSDRTHVNRNGAREYTHALAGLVAGWLADHPAQVSSRQ